MITTHSISRFQARLLWLACMLSLGLPSITIGATPMSVDELSAAIAAGQAPLMVDVRETETYQGGTIQGAINAPAAFIGARQLPPVPAIVLFDDGLGRPLARSAAEAISTDDGRQVYWLRGGFAAWLDASGPTTIAMGVKREQLPRMNFRELQESDLSEAILVDMRAAPPGGEVASPMADGEANRDANLVSDFARDQGIAHARGNPLQFARRGSSANAAPMSTGGALPAVASEAAPLLVLIDDDYLAAENMARKLRAAGHHRVVILTGGTEAIRHQGREGQLRRSHSTTVHTTDQ